MRLKPSVLLCLVCLAIVHRLRPRWVSVTLKEAASAEGASPQQLSRLCTKSIPLFDNVISLATRMGRPPKQDQDRELSLLGALLHVATSILSQLSLNKPLIRALLMGAYLKLKQDHQVTQKEFCTHLAIPQRTLRYWLNQSKETPPPPPATDPQTAAPEKKPKLRRPRFGFEVTLPGTQLGADTTDFSAFGVDLKLMACQDIGGRDQNLFESVIVDNKEDADRICQMMQDAIQDNKGIQMITDQGTAYLAQKTKDTLEALEVDHAPQKEGDPQGKATVEKAFDTIKRIAHPLLEITNQLASKIQKLRQTELAKSVATVLFAALLRAYQAGARATRRSLDAREGISEEKLQELAQQNREKAHAENRSARLLLTRIHQLYEIEQPRLSFIRNLRTFPLDVLKQAEQAFGRQVHRNDIHKRGSYFAAIVRNINATYQKRKATHRWEQEQAKQRLKDEQAARRQQKTWWENPCTWLLVALKALASQWLPEKSELLFNGHGLGMAWLKSSIARMIDLYGNTMTRQLAVGVLSDFKKTHNQLLGWPGIDQILRIVDKYLPKDPDQNTDCIENFMSAILKTTGPPPCLGPRTNC